jgi:hypothetical protein
MKGARVSVIVESQNAGNAHHKLSAVLQALGMQVPSCNAEIIVTSDSLPRDQRQRLQNEMTSASGAANLIRWVEVAKTATYYDHKNAGFDAATGEIICFIDSDCSPSPDWLAHLIAPFEHGAWVVAGYTSYAGDMAGMANQMDFPYFDVHRRQVTSSTPRQCQVLNFFVNNVAFSRSVFASRRFPSGLRMFKGQCQLLALQLQRDNITIWFAPSAVAVHAWPDNLSDLIRVRILRGADLRAILPHITSQYRPRALPLVSVLGPMPALGVIALRTMIALMHSAQHPLRTASTAYALTAGIFDSVGALIPGVCYRLLTNGRLS